MTLLLVAVQIQKIPLQPAANRLLPMARPNSLIPAKKVLRRELILPFALVAGWFATYWANGRVWNWLLYTVLGLDPKKRLTESIHFFLYDAVKISLLLVGITFVVTIARSFITVERTRAFLGGKTEGLGNVLAAGLGVLTPFCSCSAVPVFIGFVSAGIPIGVTLSFLIASPLVNEIAVGLLFTMFGWKIAAIYLLSGLLIAITAGFILGRMKVERWVEPFVYQTRLNNQATSGLEEIPVEQRVRLGVEESAAIFRKIWIYLLVGIGLGALIHGWVPADFFIKYAGASNPFGVLLAVLIGIPLYSNAAGVIPIVQALFDKGLPMGTLLAFMMSVVALSLPEMILLRRVLKPQLLAAFIAVVGVGIVIVGYLFNFLLA